jgi:flagellar motor switch protein FliN/FliY
MNESAASSTETAPIAGETSVEARVPDFSPLQANQTSGSLMPLNRLYDVSVTVSVELGRVLTTIGNLLSLGAGSVLELNRPLSEPVDLVADGVLLARGEVVVVDDCFAVRIKEIESPQGQGKT